jgi:hypothetical protein
MNQWYSRVKSSLSLKRKKSLTGREQLTVGHRRDSDTDPNSQGISMNFRSQATFLGARIIEHQPPKLILG